jgi:hypothetical protein
MFELTDPVVHHAEPPLESDSERSWGRTDKGEASWACVRGLPCLYRLCGGPSSDLPLCSPCTLPPPSTCSLSGRRERDQKLFQDARVQCCVSSLESAGLHRVSEIGLAWRCVIWSYGSWRFLDAVRAGTPVEIVGAAPCYVHLSGVPGVPQFVTRMQPKVIMRSEDALDDVPLADRDTHWLNSPARDGKTIWETSPFLLVGAGAWGTDVTSFPEPSMARYGRVGAPWWVVVKRNDKEA